MNYSGISYKKLILEVLETFFVSIIVISLISTFIAAVETVSGSSMEPNFFTGDKILVDKVTKHLKPLERGEVLVVRSPAEPSKHLVKRVIALPGEYIKIFDCKVFLTKDEEKYVLSEDYLSANICTKGGLTIRDGRTIQVPEDKYLLLGDNREVSIDSRNLGLIDKDLILGRVIFRFWPIRTFGFIS